MDGEVYKQFSDDGRFFNDPYITNILRVGTLITPRLNAFLTNKAFYNMGDSFCVKEAESGDIFSFPGNEYVGNTSELLIRRVQIHPMLGTAYHAQNTINT